jgi:glycosyltransferase involved in cell wall biosynthesis
MSAHTLLPSPPVPGRVAFVPLRYGPGVVGGSETQMREFATGLAARGWDVEVLTSRAVDHTGWSDDLPEGASEEDGLVVRRFSSVHRHSPAGLKAQKAIQAGAIPAIDEQWTWVSWRYAMPDLFHHLLRHGHTFDSVVFSPYLFWHTIVGVSAVPDNAVVMPCLHDESYARLDVVRHVLSTPRSVWFQSEPEHRLAHRLGPVTPHHVLTGNAMNVPDAYDPVGFRARHGLTRPFLLYAGRREHDKGWDWLLETFASASRHGNDSVDLVTIGVGQVEAPGGMEHRVIDLGYVSDEERNNAFAAAVACVQPSRMESFSRTVMEAWLAGTPVLVIEGSEAVEWHLARCGGGVTFRDGPTLARGLEQLAGDPVRASELAEAGRAYVLAEYASPVVIDRIEADLVHLATAGRVG